MATRNPHAAPFAVRTHGGGFASHPGDVASELRRVLTTTMLFEPSYYASADETATHIRLLIESASKTDIPAIFDAVIKARTTYKIRMAPLWAAACLAHGHGRVGSLLPQIIRRPDECCEFLQMYWHLSGTEAPLSHQVKVGLSAALRTFSPYQLAKWQEKKRKIKLRDVIRLVHPTPKDDAQSAAFKGILDGSITPPDTWEVALSAGADKQATWARLLTERKLGYIALLMNLRNMIEAKVDIHLIAEALIHGAAHSWALPMRFVAAARAAPKLEPALDVALRHALRGFPQLPGRTLLVVDVSGSMQGSLAAQSGLDRIDAAGALAALAAGICEHVTLYATAGSDAAQVHKTKELPARPNLAALDLMRNATLELGGGGIFLTRCMDYIATREPEPFDRVLVFTDEQDTDAKLRPDQAKKLGAHNYIMNVAAYAHGIATDGGWERISGYSERVFDWIRASEGLEVAEPPEGEQAVQADPD